MQQVIINVGVSGSGKTSWTSDFMNKYPKFLRINRDDIRKTLVGTLKDYYQRKNLNTLEEFVNKIEQSLFYHLVYEGFSVIIDNTNLKESYINRWIKEIEGYNLYEEKKEHELQFRFKIFDDVNIETCRGRVVLRDSLTSDKVDYIYKQYQSFNNIKQFIYKNYKNKII